MRRTLRITAAALVAVLLGVMPIVAAAQAPPDPAPPAWLAWFAGFLQNPLLLLGVGTASARWSGLRRVVANWFIPYLKTGIALAGVLIQFGAGIVGPSPAHALAGPLAVATVAPLFLGGFNFFGSVGGLLGGVASAAWQAAQAHLLYRMYLHKKLGPDPDDSRQ